MPSDLDPSLNEPLAELLLTVADDKLMLGHRNSDWTGLAPILEEDIAFSSLAQDEIGHAQALYELAGSLLGRDANDLAFGRGPDAYRCCAVVEMPDDFDWAVAICRQFFCDHFDALRLARLARATWEPLAQLARRLHAEEQVHVEHVDAWVRRLGTGTDESRERMQAALDTLAPVGTSLFEPVRGEAALVAGGVLPGDDDAFAAWTTTLGDVADDAGLRLELAPPPADFVGGRRGRHHEQFAALLDEMCEVYRLAPGAAW
jgi:ring-1,2-phenylacetyl-CoA epoxidase subunit PaaC